MNESLIANWNDVVAPTDTIYCLGDFGFGDNLQSILNRLNGEKHLVFGNHDKPARNLTGWASMSADVEITINKQFIVLHHYAKRIWNKAHHGAIHLYGHSHGSMPGNAQSLDVGVDCWEYKPISLLDIQRRLKTLPKFTGYREQAGGSDHHSQIPGDGL